MMEEEIEKELMELTNKVNKYSKIGTLDEKINCIFYIHEKLDKLNHLAGAARPEVLEEVSKKLDINDKVIDIMAERIVDLSGSCPLDSFNICMKDEQACNDSYKECFIKYYTDLAEHNINKGEGVK